MNKTQSFRRLLAYIGRYKWLTFLALSFLLLTTIVQTVIPLAAQYFIDHMITHVGQAELLFLAGYYALYLLQMVISFVGNLLFARVSYSIVRDMRQDAFATIEKLGMRYYDQTASGAIVSRLTNDTETVSDMFSGVLSTFVSAIFIFSVTFYTMLMLDLRLTGLVVLLLPLIFILVYFYRKFSVHVVRETRARLSDLNVKLSEGIEGIRVVQAFRQEQRLINEFNAVNDQHLYYANRSTALDSLFLRPAMSLLKLVAYAVLLSYFGLTWQNLPISAGLMYAFIQYVNRLFDPLISVTQNFSTLQTSMVAAGRVFELIDQEGYEPEQTGTSGQITRGDIRFEHVNFSYDGERPILKDVSFEVKAGQTIAFVGSTGSGKSSIINVFMRFYEFQSGRVTIDGQDIRNFSAQELRDKVGLVLQEPFLYHGTIASNIRMYQDMTDEEVVAAAEFVNANQFINQLPLQYEAPVTERGATFSTGQRQLLAFARTIATQPKILILDEATANIDSATEDIIQNSLKKMRQGRTTIAIAHRLSTIQDANCIYVLDQGRIIESGTHEELLAQAGTYYQMYRLQTGDLEKMETVKKKS